MKASWAYGRDIALARRVQALPNREIRTQVWQDLNNSPLRLEAYRSWANQVLDAARPGNSAQVLGFVGEEIAGFMQSQLPEGAPVRIVAINEKRLVHADSEKHRADGIALNRDQMMALPGIVTQPDGVYFDRKYGHFVFTRQLADGIIYAALENDQALKHAGRLDALVNAYRLPDTQDGAGRLRDGNRFVKMGGADR